MDLQEIEVTLVKLVSQALQVTEVLQELLAKQVIQEQMVPLDNQVLMVSLAQ